MLDITFKEELKKNKVLSNKSNKFCKLFFRCFSGCKQIKLFGGGYISYGYIFVECTKASILKFYYKDILISCLSGDKQVIIPLSIENNSTLRIEGECGNLKVLIFGSKAQFVNNYLIPMKNCIVNDCGDFIIFTYSSKDDLLNNELTKLFQYHKLYSSQVFMVEDKVIHGNLYYENGVYLCMDADNYTSNILIEDSIQDGVIVPTNNIDGCIVVYIKDGEIYYRHVNNGVVSEEIKIDRSGIARPMRFLPIEVNSFGINLFAVLWNNGSASIYNYLDNMFTNKFTFKCEKAKIVLDESSLEIDKIDDYSVSISKYVIDENSINLNTGSTSVIKDNVDDVYLVENTYLCLNGGNCTEVKIV